MVRDIGYEQDGFHWETLRFENHLHGQSAHIAQGVDASGNKDEGAGDQGIMFGFACDETPDLMPAALDYSHKILARMAQDRKSGAAPFLEPDSKSQVTVEYSEDGTPNRIDTVVMSTQHGPEWKNDQAGLKDAGNLVWIRREGRPGRKTRDNRCHQNITRNDEKITQLTQHVFAFYLYTYFFSAFAQGGRYRILSGFGLSAGQPPGRCQSSRR